MITLTVNEFTSITRSNPDVNIVDCFNKITIIDEYDREMASISSNRAYY